MLYNNDDNSIAKSWLLTLLTVIANMTLNDVATIFVILSAGVSTGYTAGSNTGTLDIIANII